MLLMKILYDLFSLLISYNHILGVSRAKHGSNSCFVGANRVSLRLINLKYSI